MNRILSNTRVPIIKCGWLRKSEKETYVRRTRRFLSLINWEKITRRILEKGKKRRKRRHRATNCDRIGRWKLTQILLVSLIHQGGDERGGSIRKKKRKNREEETGRKYDPERSGLERVSWPLGQDKRRKFCRPSRSNNEPNR